MSVYTEDTKRVYTLLQELHELEKEVDAIHKEIDEKIGKIDLSMLATKAELNGLATKEEVNGLATKAELTNLQGQVTAVDSRVDSVGQEISTQVTNLENLSAVTPTEIKSVVGDDKIERLYLAHDGEVLTGQDGLNNRLVVNTDINEEGLKGRITQYFTKIQNVNIGIADMDGDYYLGCSTDETFTIGRINTSTGAFETSNVSLLHARIINRPGLPYFALSDGDSEVEVYDLSNKKGILGWDINGYNTGYSVVSGTGIPVFKNTDFTFVKPETMISDYFAKGNTGDGLIRALPSTGKFSPQMPTILFYDGHTGKWSVTSVDTAQQGKDQMLVYNATTHGLEFRPIN